MKWNELIIKVRNNSVDAINNYLGSLGTIGLNVTRIPKSIAIIHSYFNSQVDIGVLKSKSDLFIKSLFKDGLNPGHFSIKLNVVDDSHWRDAWEKYYHPMRITRFLTIVPSWQKYSRQQSGERIIRMNPERAFGTGIHPTTRISLEALEAVVRGGEDMIDVGTGSGILSIAARKLGVSRVDACDVTKDAIRSVRENLKLNRMTNVHVKINNLLVGVHKSFDIIVANVVPVLLLKVIPSAKPLLKKHGRLILSGILDTKRNLVFNSLKRNDFQLKAIYHAGHWYGVIAFRMGDK